MIGASTQTPFAKNLRTPDLPTTRKPRADRSLSFLSTFHSKRALLERFGVTTVQGGRLRDPSRASWPSYHAINSSSFNKAATIRIPTDSPLPFVNSTLQHSHKSKVSCGEAQHSGNFHPGPQLINRTQKGKHRNRNHFEAAFLCQRSPISLTLHITGA